MFTKLLKIFCVVFYGNVFLDKITAIMILIGSILFSWWDSVTEFTVQSQRMFQQFQLLSVSRPRFLQYTQCQIQFLMYLL